MLSCYSDLKFFLKSNIKCSQGHIKAWHTHTHTHTHRERDTILVEGFSLIRSLQVCYIVEVSYINTYRKLTHSWIYMSMCQFSICVYIRHLDDITHLKWADKWKTLYTYYPLSMMMMMNQWFIYYRIIQMYSTYNMIY